MAPSDVVKRLGDTLALSGATLGLGALYGWWQTYSTVLDFGYISVRAALRCTLEESAGCTLARVLCRDTHPYCVGDYDAGALWLGFLLMFAGTLMGGWRRPKKRPAAAENPSSNLWFEETRLRMLGTIQHAASTVAGNDNIMGPVVPLSLRKRKPR
jgi:hypothetical protein